MATSNYAAGLDDHEGRNVSREEILQNVQETAESFSNVEDDINGLFEHLYENKIRLHKDWKTLQRNVNELMKQSEKTQVDPAQDRKIEQYQNEISEYKQEIDSLKTQLSDSQSTINDLNGKILQYSSKKEKQEDDHKISLKLAKEEMDSLKTQFKGLLLTNKELTEKMHQYSSEKEIQEDEHNRNLQDAKLEIDSLKIQLRESEQWVKDLTEKFQLSMEKEKEKEENADNRNLQDAKLEIDSLKIQLRESEQWVKDLTEKFQLSMEKEKEKEENADNRNLQDAKLEIDSLKIQLRESEQWVKDLTEKFQLSMEKEKEKEQNVDNSDHSLEAWVKVERGINNDLSKNLQKSYTEKKLEIVKIMDDFYDRQWIAMYNSLTETRIFKAEKIYDILYYTLWDSYQFTCRMLDQQVKKLKEDLYLPFGNVSQTPERAIPIEIENSLREVVLKCNPQEKEKKFKEQLFPKFSDEAKYLATNPEFNTYINEGLYLIDSMILMHINCFLKSHRLEKLDGENFKVFEGPTEKCKVKKGIFPALVTATDGEAVVIRKGLVYTVSE